ncbi:Phosphoribosylformylglycinamidine cyclo-ligase, chloroplastic/mitochondrial [Orobanche gracilis]
MNALCGANTGLSHCITNLCNPSSLKIRNDNIVKGFLPFVSKNRRTEVQNGIGTLKNRFVLSVSGNSESHAEPARENKDKSLTYKDAGVDIDACSELVRRISKMTPGIGGFGGLFPLGDNYLVASTDGVGTKLKLAFETGIHETIGIDLVAMSVNDIVTSGAKPLFFLDYFATSRLDVDLAEKVIKGIVDGCRQSDCPLLGGETAEMPGFYADGEYDLSGFAIGTVNKDSVIDGKNIEIGDVLIGLPSSGVHSNRFSLVRRGLELSGLSLKNNLPGSSATLGQALMEPMVIYVKQVLDFITKEAGRIKDAEMIRTFNMGIGMVLVVKKEAALRILGDDHAENSVYRIGEVISGDGVSYR